MLGHRPPGKDVGASENIVVLCRPRLKVCWLELRFSNPLPVDAINLLVQQFTRFYILEMLGGMLFTGKFGERALSRIYNFSIQSIMERILAGIVQH